MLSTPEQYHAFEAELHRGQEAFGVSHRSQASIFTSSRPPLFSEASQKLRTVEEHVSCPKFNHSHVLTTQVAILTNWRSPATFRKAPIKSYVFSE